MNARYWQKGETLDYTATKEAVTNGQVVSLGGRIGVAGNDISDEFDRVYHECIFRQLVRRMAECGKYFRIRFRDDREFGKSSH